MAAPVPHSARVVRLARRPPPSPARDITASAGLPSARSDQAPVARQGSLAYELSHIVPDASSPAVDVAPAIQEAGAIQEVGAKGNVFQRVRTLLRLFSTGVLRSVAALINDPVGAVDRMREAVLPLIQKVPLALEKVLDEDLAPAFDSAMFGSPGAVDLLASAAGVPAKASHWEGIWRHIRVRLAYIGEHFWEVIKDAALELLIPGVALYRHIPEMLVAIEAAWASAWAGNFSDAIDHVLELLRALMAIVTTFIAQVSIAAFILGSVFGTPVVGVAALTAIGIATIAIDAGIQAATIRKSVYNLGQPNRSEKQDEVDYGRIADSSLALAIMAALLLLGALASKAASALVRRFPAVAAVAESLKGRLRGAVGLKPRRPVAPRPSALAEVEAGIEPRPRMAAEYEVRSSLSPSEQLAFDKWIAERRADMAAKGVSPKDIDANLERALNGKTPDQVRNMVKKQLGWVDEQQRRQAQAAEMRAAGDPLDPKARNGPTRAGGDDVWTRWDDDPPSPKEVGEAARLAARTGERIDLFGDGYEGIDGTIGKPPRPLQLKGLQASDPPAEAVRVAKDALNKARSAGKGYSNVEVSIEAPGATVEQVRAEFSLANAAEYLDGRIISRIRVWCANGLFEPTAFTPVPPPPHIDLERARQ